MLKKIVLLMVILLLSIGLFTGCELIDEDEPIAVGLEISGNWVDNYSTNYIITDSTWVTDGTYGASNGVVEYDNSINILYYIQDSTSSFNADKYGKIVWTDVVDGNGSNVFYYCTVAYGKDTLEEIKADTTQADSSDPANSGCGGFSWTKMTR